MQTVDCSHNGDPILGLHELHGTTIQCPTWRPHSSKQNGLFRWPWAAQHRHTNTNYLFFQTPARATWPSYTPHFLSRFSCSLFCKKAVRKSSYLFLLCSICGSKWGCDWGKQLCDSGRDVALGTCNVSDNSGNSSILQCLKITCLGKSKSWRIMQEIRNAFQVVDHTVRCSCLYQQC